MTHTLDWPWMRRALDLAERGRGYVEPNPLVGAVVVRDGQCVGEGWHERYGQAHAEVNALNAAGEQARGATLYVTLEPCCHHGKTPPCTDAILQAGISRTVAAMADPFPPVSSKGAERLRAAGVTVDIGLGEAEARRLNAPYVHLLATGRPYVTAKWAMTLDGKIATATGESKWISNKSSRHRVHEVRGRMDGIVVGIGTALADDPLLTARPPGPRTPLRIVLDSQARLPVASQLARSARDVPTLIVTSDRVPVEASSQLRALGCEVLALPAEQGRPRLDALLDELGRRRLTNLLIEGGSGVLGSFHDLGAIQEVYVFVAPRLVGGAAARSPIGGTGSPTLAESLRLTGWRIESIGEDVLLHGWR
jgi:diaminohydroxyphosphoribosylaminopyrimidine deaminase / 5-amino-6-(5-phosphoribosylamino)uracil reductase